MLLKNLRLRNLAVLTGLGVVIAPCAFCFWLFWWPDIQANLSLRLYPGLKQVGDAYGGYGADTGLKILYYWTQDPIETVQGYYESFAYPFVDDPWGGGLVTVFSLDGSELVYRTIDSINHKLDFPTNKYCRYTQLYKCANVMLISVDSAGLEELRTLVSGPSWINTKSPSPTTKLASGTVIIYSYYISDY